MWVGIIQMLETQIEQKNRGRTNSLFLLELGRPSPALDIEATGSGAFWTQVGTEHLQLPGSWVFRLGLSWTIAFLAF